MKSELSLSVNALQKCEDVYNKGDVTACDYTELRESHMQYYPACHRYACEDCCHEEFDHNLDESIYHCIIVRNRSLISLDPGHFLTDL